MPNKYIVSPSDKQILVQKIVRRLGRVAAEVRWKYRKLKGDWWKAKLCTACVSPLGRILSRGGHCPQCGLRVCKNCRYYLDGGDQNQENVATTNGGSNHPGWICILCSGSAPRAPSSSLPRSAFGKAGAKSIRRSWTISNPPRGNDQENNSPVLKSFIMYNDDTVIGLNSPNTRQFNSLPRLTYGIKLQDLQTPRSERAADRRFSYSTLYPFKNNKTKSTSSVNFIEDPFWDYYDYNIINSNRSSCERSLGDVEYCSYIIDPADNIKLNPGTDILARDPTSNHDSKTLPKSVPPKKPDRPSKRSNSLNSYDQRHLLSFSPLRTYVVLRQPTPTSTTSTPSTNAAGSGGSTKKRSSSFNLDLQSGPKRNRGGDGRDNDMGYAEAKTPLREYHQNCNQVFEEEFQARAMTTAPPVLKPKRFFSGQDQVVFPSSEELKSHTFQSTPVQGENMQRRSASAMGGDEGLDKAQIRDRERDAQWLNNIRAEINSAYAFNSLPPKRKGKVTVTSPVALSPEDFQGERSSNAIKTASNHHHTKLARSNSVDDKPLSKQAKYFFDHRIDSPVKTTSPIPKPPRKSIASPLPTGLPTGSLQPRELVFPDSGSEGSRRGGGHETIIPIIAEDGYAKEPEIDPKLQELLKKSEIILNATLTTSSLINSPPTIEGNVNVVQIAPTQVHTFPRRGKHHVSTTVPVTATSPGSNPNFATNYSSMSSSLDRRIGPKKDFYKQAVKVNVNGAGSPSSAEFVSSTNELVVEEVLCTDDEDEHSNVAWLSVKGKESGKNQPSYTKNSNFNHKSDLDQQPHPHLSDHHHHQPHHHPQFSRTCEQNENLDNSNSLLLLGRGINSVKNARKKSQGELMSTPHPHASQSQEGTTTTTTSLGVEHSKSRSMHDRKQDAATVGGSTWVYKHVPEEDYVRRSQVCNNTQILFNEHEENGGGGALVRPTRNESGSRNSNHSNCTSSSNPTVPSTNNCSKLSDLNNPQQYAPVTPTRDSKSPNFSAPTSPRSDDKSPGNRGKNLRIIKGRLSNEFVTTVQISSSDPLDEPEVTPIVRISNHSQSSNNVQVVPVLESSEFGAGTRKIFSGNQGQFEQREGHQGVNLGRPVGQGGKEQVICVTSKNGRAIPDTELGEEREAKEERALPSAPVKDDKEQGFNLCEARVHSLQETDHLTTKVSHAHESKPVAAANVGVLLNGFHSVSTIGSPGLGENCVLNSQNSVEKQGTDELREPPIPLIKACRSPDIPDFRSSTSTEDTTSTADTIIDFLESQANIDTEGSDTDTEETSFLDSNEYGVLTQDSNRSSTGGEPRLLAPSVQHPSGGTGAGVFAVDADTVEERVVVIDIANHGLESSILECQSASCERAEVGANGVELISQEHVQEKVDQVSEGSSTIDDISSCTSSVVGIDHEQPPSKTPSVVDTEADECDTDDGIIEETLDKSLENLSDISTVPIRSENLLEYLHNLTLNIQRNNCKNSGNNTQANELTAKHSDILSELAQVPELQYCNENERETKGLSENNKLKHGIHEERVREVTNHGVNSSVMEHHERLTPEGQESFTDDSSSTTKRSSPDGEAIQDVKLTRMEEEAFQVTSSDSDNSWIEEIPYEEEGPPPLDLTLHTIVEESCEESADESEKSLRMGRKPLDELENYFNYLDPAQSRNVSRKLANEDSEFSDTFSESSFHSEGNQNQEEDNSIDPVDLASTRLEKYFTNLGYSKPIPPPPNHHISAKEDSEDSVGSESECDDHLQDKKKKVFKHKRSANVSDDESMIFDLDEGAYDTIKRSKKKSNSNQHNNSSAVTESNHGSQGSVMGGGGAQTKGTDEPDGVKGPQEVRSAKEEVSPSIKPKQVLLNRSNSFQWSSDEEVNLMMSKLRQLVKGLMQKGQSVPAESNAQLRYFETELIRLMRSEPELKNIVSEYISSEESDDNEFNQFIKEVVQQQDDEGSAGPERNQYPYSSYSSHDSHGSHRQFSSKLPKDIGGPSGSGTSPASPALIAKVMHHIGNRLSVWMKDEDEEGTLKCAPSVSSDLNEDRFSWKGSFESTLAAKRQSVGSTDSISSSDLNNQLSQAAGTGSGVDRSILRSSSLHHLANSQPIEEKKEEEENISNSLPRLNQVTHMPRAQSLLGIGKEKVKSARYRPPGFTQTSSSIKPMNDKMSVSTPALHQDIMPDTPPMNLRGSDSIISVYEPGLSQVNVRGQIEFSLQYNYKLAALEVKVKQCRDLAAVDTKRHRSDPYVKAYLLPDKSKSGKRKTKTKKNTLNPIFEETLKFPITLSELQSRTLWVSVWHSDIFGKNEFLGQVIIPLKDRIFDEPSPIWWQLEEMTDQVDERPRGDIIIALKWQARTDSTGNLSILVKEAKNLLPVKSGMPSTFVKCCPLKESKSSHRSKQKTSIARRTLHPIWNQTLYFEDVADDGVEITLWNHDLLSNHDLIGMIKLDQNVQLWESMLNRHSFWVEGVLKLEAEH